MTHDQNLMACIYRETKAGLNVLAQEFELSPSTVRRRLIEVGVALRGPGRPRKQALLKPGGMAERRTRDSEAATAEGGER